MPLGTAFAVRLSSLAPQSAPLKGLNPLDPLTRNERAAQLANALSSNPYSAAFTRFPYVVQEGCVTATPYIHDLERLLRNSTAEQQKSVIRVTAVRCPNQAIHKIELVVDRFGPHRRSVILGRQATDQALPPNAPLHQIGRPQTGEPQGATCQQCAKTCVLDDKPRHSLAKGARRNVVEYRLMDRCGHGTAGVERWNAAVV